MYMLFSAQFGVLAANTTTTQFGEMEPGFQTVFRHTWADHANLISVQYAGTGALKTDYTRTGKVQINYLIPQSTGKSVMLVGDAVYISSS